jgi:hypothetical protein
MTRRLAIAIGLATLALPSLAQEHAYDYQDESGSAWSDEPAPPGDGTYGEYPADEARAGVDVNVDMATPDASVTFDTFRDGLAPYGEWMDVPNYGRVWRPARVAAGWRPYYYGRWEWTDEGWLWVSDEPWGWAAYHYGRWAYEPYYGWVWAPGYQWAPAWVTWRTSPDYIGWAPLAPGFSVFVSAYPVSFSWWTFVPCARFVAVPVFAAAVPFAHVRNIYHAAVPAPPRARVFGAVAPAWGGPARPFVERSIGRPIAPVRVQPVASASAVAGAARPGVVPIYRPEVRPAPAGGRPAVAAPTRPWSGAPGRAGVAPAPGPGMSAPGRAGVVPAPHPGSAPGRAGIAPAPGPSTPAPGQGAVRQAPPPRGNNSWRGAPPASQGPAPAGRPEGRGIRPQQSAPQPRRGPPTGTQRMMAPPASSSSVHFAPAPRAQLQGSVGSHGSAQVQRGGSAQVQRGGSAQVQRGGGAQVQRGSGGHPAAPSHGGGHR